MNHSKIAAHAALLALGATVLAAQFATAQQAATAPVVSAPRALNNHNHTPLIFGPLQSDPARTLQMNAAGVTLARVGVEWNRYQPLQLASRPDALQARIMGEIRGFNAWLQANNARGFIGEMGWPDDARGDSEAWNALAEAWFREADKSGLWVTNWATGEWWGDGYALAPYEDRVAGGGVDTPNTQAAIVEAHLGDKNVLRGVNVAGGEFGDGEDFSNRKPGAYDQKYHYDTQETFDFLAKRGLTLVRIPFRWERLQPELGGELDADELGRLKAVVARARRAGLRVVLDLHNYARYKSRENGQVVEKTLGSPQLTATQLGDLWVRMSGAFKDDPEVFYGLMNEPHDLPDADGKNGARQWEEISQSMLSAIRQNGDNKMILVPGYSWSGVHTWSQTHPKGWISDPAKNFRYEAHHYFDATAAGQYHESYAQTVSAAERAGFTGAPQ